MAFMAFGVGWAPKVDFEGLVKLMYEADLVEERKIADRAATMHADVMRTHPPLPGRLREAGFEGYVPDKVPVKAGEEVTLVFTRTIKSHCLAEVMIPSLNVKKDLPQDQPVARGERQERERDEQCAKEDAPRSRGDELGEPIGQAHGGTLPGA